ncbi:hypothetical protein ACI3L3_02110 [Desulfobaculum sp. SPO524]|uniref:hypothetical protein n=1 Tax=Desulfobaculum sp. SPO524 TaxID=3378071 RepID=UPI003851A60B
MAAKRFYALHFDGDTEHWEQFDGARLAPCEPPSGTPDLPVVALIPDDHIFFFHPDDISLTKARAMRAACLLRMEHLFPQPQDGQERGLVHGGAGGLLGFVTGPGLDAFWERHAESLAHATLVSSKFLLGWNVAAQRSLDRWTMSNGSSPHLLTKGGMVHRTPDSAELSRRMDDGDQPAAVDWREALTEVGTQPRMWSRLRLPLTRSGSREGMLRHVGIAAACITVAAVLALSVSVRQYLHYSAEAETREAALSELYARALGPDQGPAPYRRLVSLHARLKGEDIPGFDVLSLLGTLSAKAPQGLKVDSLTLAPGKGSLRGTLPNYDAVEQYLSALKDAPGYTFTLQQATTAEGGVVFGMNVTVTK